MGRHLHSYLAIAAVRIAESWFGLQSIRARKLCRYDSPVSSGKS